MEHPSETRNRWLIVTLAAVSSFMIFTTTESCFVKADIRNAVNMVQTLKAGPNSTTIPEALKARHPDVSIASIGWDGEITDNYYGFVRVRAAVPAPKEVILYFFDVNLSGQRLHPGNERATQLLQDIREKTEKAPVGPSQAPDISQEFKKSPDNLDPNPNDRE